MKKNQILQSFFVLTASAALLLGCTMGKSGETGGNNVARSTASPGGGDLGTGGGSSGLAVSGTGALSVPPADAIIMRLQNALQISSQAGNFKKSLVQLKSNLPKVTDPTKATGFDQVQLLVYAACSDLTTGTTPKMKSSYNVNPSGTIASNQTNLVAAGVKMLDAYLAGLASQGTAASQVQDALTSLVQTLASDSANTSKIAFMSVCMAANVTGSTMMGY